MRVPVSSPWPDGHHPGSRPGSQSGTGLCWATVPEAPIGAHLPGRNRRPDRGGTRPSKRRRSRQTRPSCVATSDGVYRVRGVDGRPSCRCRPARDPVSRTSRAGRPRRPPLHQPGRHRREHRRRIPFLCLTFASVPGWGDGVTEVVDRERGRRQTQPSRASFARVVVRIAHEPRIPQSLVRSQIAGQPTSAPQHVERHELSLPRAITCCTRLVTRSHSSTTRATFGSFFTRPNKRAHGPVSTQKAPSSHRNQTWRAVGPLVAIRAVSGCCRKVSTSKPRAVTSPILRCHALLAHRPPTQDQGPTEAERAVSRPDAPMPTLRRREARRGHRRRPGVRGRPGASKGRWRSAGTRRGGRGGRCRGARARSKERKVRWTVLSSAGRG